MAANLSVQVHFDPTDHQITFSGDINTEGQILFPASDQAAVVTLTLDPTSVAIGVIFPTHADDQQNAIVWSGPAGQYSQTGWARQSGDTVILTALTSATGIFSYGFTVWVNYQGTNYPSSDPSIANADIPPIGDVGERVSVPVAEVAEHAA